MRTADVVRESAWVKNTVACLVQFKANTHYWHVNTECLLFTSCYRSSEFMCVDSELNKHTDGWTDQQGKHAWLITKLPFEVEKWPRAWERALHWNHRRKKLFYLIKNTAKTIIVLNNITILNNCFRFSYILKCNLFLWCQSWIFSSHYFSVTWSFRNHSNLLSLW